MTQHCGKHGEATETTGTQHLLRTGRTDTPDLRALSCFPFKIFPLKISGALIIRETLKFENFMYLN